MQVKFGSIFPTKIQRMPEHPLVGMCWNLGFDITKLLNWEKFPLHSGELCADVLHSAIHQKILNPDNVKSTCDFGAGKGLPTYIIQKAFKLDNGAIVALEKRPIMPGLLDESSVVVGDGIEFLKEGKRSFDLITGCMLGPVHERGGFLEKLFPAISKSLNPGSKFLTYSDTGSMSRIKKFLDTNGIKYDSFTTFRNEIEALAVLKEELSKLNDGVLKLSKDDFFNYSELLKKYTLTRHPQ